MVCHLVKRKDEPLEAAAVNDLLDCVEGGDVLLPAAELAVGEGEGGEQQLGRRLAAHQLRPRLRPLEAWDEPEAERLVVSVVEELREVLGEGGGRQRGVGDVGAQVPVAEGLEGGVPGVHALDDVGGGLQLGHQLLHLVQAGAQLHLGDVHHDPLAVAGEILCVGCEPLPEVGGGRQEPDGLELLAQAGALPRPAAERGQGEAQHGHPARG